MNPEGIWNMRQIFKINRSVLDERIKKGNMLMKKKVVAYLLLGLGKRR